MNSEAVGFIKGRWKYMGAKELTKDEVYLPFLYGELSGAVPELKLIRCVGAAGEDDGDRSA